MSDEHWKEVVGFPGYEVSDLGNVRSIAAIGSRRRGKVLVTVFNGNGYPCVSLHQNGKQYLKQVHTLVAVAFLGRPPSEKHEVAHNDGDRRNTVVTNLRWATRAENHADKLLHDTHNRGERHGMSRLTNQQAAAAIAQRDAGWSIKQLASEYGVAYGTMEKLLRGSSWEWMPRPAKRDHKAKGMSRNSLIVEKRGASLVAANAEATAALATVKEGRRISIKIADRERSVTQNGMYWRVLERVVEATGRWHTPEELHLALKVACGYVDKVRLLNGRLVLCPGSIAFDRLNQEEAQRYYDAALKIVAEEIMDCPIEDLLAA